ncbi:MAG: SgcJ/EcaC family oxidoreductase [Polyangiales bacterium]
MTDDEHEIREAHSTWINAVNGGDLACLLTLMADDVVLLSPGQSPAARDDFSTHYLAAQERIRFHCVSELEEVVVVGEVAFTRSRDALSVTPRVGGETARFAGYRMTIYRKQRDGRWLLARDAHTLSPV